MTESDAEREHDTDAGDASPASLPRLVVSSVVRSSHQGESHGGVFIVDLAAGSCEQVIDWDDESISWEGRGADRGLRGIAFHDELVYLAASDEIFVYDRSFRQQGSFRNEYLKHCHEITVEGDVLYATSTGFDSILAYDIRAGAFTDGVCLRYDSVNELRRKVAQAVPALVGVSRPMPGLSRFDPSRPGGPVPGDTTHLNNVSRLGGATLACGTRLASVLAVKGSKLFTYARVPFGSHNASPFRDGILMNHTRSDRICYLGRRGKVLRSWPIVRYAREDLENAALPEDQARQAFGRGLAVLDDDRFVGGSSPATVTLYRFDRPDPVVSVNLTRDVRNAIHGLEVWPF